MNEAIIEHASLAHRYQRAKHGYKIGASVVSLRQERGRAADQGTGRFPARFSFPKREVLLLEGDDMRQMFDAATQLFRHGREVRAADPSRRRSTVYLRGPTRQKKTKCGT